MKRDLVFKHLKEFGPATDEELTIKLGIPGNTVRPRRIELVRDGLVKDSGNIRATTSGRTAVVWQAV